ncbi:MAG: type II toxin-antitoxin system HicA family toxin [Candidatus Poribacteria bacterium]|nr:type II toxin-antitoxin system HicA family toxin [Candidatus Poribacteria bacterium]MDE0503035.1 type II toxin-antitoxin system HicA family toxin [Candidatus Poribacteria bacterium]
MTYRDISKRLKALGCTELKNRGKGSHRGWYNPSTKKATTIPYHRKREFETWTVRDIVN